MTETLQYVIDALERLPPTEQREIAERIGVELKLDGFNEPPDVFDMPFRVEAASDVRW